MITKESLEQQLVASEQELESAKAFVHRAEGAIMIVRGLLAQLEVKKDSHGSN